ncbi:MAG TPA: lytic murein transglycosylase B, partial [Aquabacterium sp.]|nr:lytic murein transglycosylase B [Aquabacterium sp.]
QQQLDEQWVSSVLAQAQVNDAVAKLIMPAASPAAKNWALYRSRFVEPLRIRAGVNFWRTHEATLRRAQETYGVPMEIIAGVIGVETIYGRNTGNFRVLDALSTLSLDFPKGRSDRSAFFQEELGQFLRLCAEQRDDPTTVLGSYAGAIGLPQFMPSSIRRLAVDFDGDGHIDLRNSPADAIGSVAHYLARSGWRKDLPTHYAVIPPKDESALGTLLAPDILPTFTAPQMQQYGALLDAPGQSHEGKLALVLLYNADAAPTYVAGTDNFYAITRYNQSSYYALAVIELGQAVAQAVRGSNN